MVQLKIGSVEGEVVDSWSELTLQQGIELHRLAFQFPSVVKQMYGLSFQNLDSKKLSEELVKLESKLTPTQRIKELPMLYGQIMEQLTTFDKSFIKTIPPAVRTAFYNKFLLKFVLGVLYFPTDIQTDTWEHRTDFTHEGITYQLPKERILNIGMHQFKEPFAQGTAIEFTEVADLEISAKDLEGGRFEVAANIIAILCRPEGESYQEQISLSRVPSLLQLPMDVVWQVFFCITKSFNTLNASILICLSRLETLEVLQKKEIVAT